MKQYDTPITYAVKHKDEAVRAHSRSGGIFTALSDHVLAQGGVIYGCVLSDKFSAVHVRAESREDRDRMRGSKYIQSRMLDCYRCVEEDLLAGRKVLFSGTSCQIAGLRGFLQSDYGNLFCVDIVCHGVPSEKIWKEYLTWRQKNRHHKIVDVDFRNKKDFGWADHVETLIFDNGTSLDSTIYTGVFYGHNALRPSCYKCPYKSIIHPGDITIADYWGIDNAVPGFNDNKGVSLVLINNDKGSAFFDAVKNTIVFAETDIEHSMQPPLEAPFPRPESRDQFWEDEKTKSFDYIARKYGNEDKKIMIKREVKKYVKKFGGGFVTPNSYLPFSFDRERRVA